MKRFSVSAGAVVKRSDGRFLAVQRHDTGAWVTPGGVVEHGEPLMAAAEREVLEETGIRVSVTHLSGVYQNLATEVISFVFHALPTGDCPVDVAGEADHVSWLSQSEAERLMTDPFYTRVGDAYSDISAIVRTVFEPNIMEPKE